MVGLSARVTQFRKSDLCTASGNQPHKLRAGCWRRAQSRYRARPWGRGGSGAGGRSRRCCCCRRWRSRSRNSCGWSSSWCGSRSCGCSWCWSRRWRTGLCAVSPAGVEDTAYRPTAPDDHFSAGPDCRMKVSGSGRIGGAGGCPTFGAGIVSPAGVEQNRTSAIDPPQTIISLPVQTAV